MAATQKGTVRYTEAPKHPQASDAPGTGRPVNPVPGKGSASVHTSPDSNMSRSAASQAKGC